MVFCNSEKWLLALPVVESHNPYFNRWFSAITLAEIMTRLNLSHNPYFNRWFSAIIYYIQQQPPPTGSQSLF